MFAVSRTIKKIGTQRLKSIFFLEEDNLKLYFFKRGGVCTLVRNKIFN